MSLREGSHRARRVRYDLSRAPVLLLDNGLARFVQPTWAIHQPGRTAVDPWRLATGVRREAEPARAIGARLHRGRAAPGTRSPRLLRRLLEPGGPDPHGVE